ncbi:ATP-grasp domain-containing protein [Patescibacteria group bacterium]|nr:ATP-grasp domain-containing protein [Patescibacteria group bacterium]MBU1967146.1 ATP-grasp domain-containing protein [Patescibacteria group bacterium]MBU2543176.1 ATP-grasp domain-containing protein [Patescibacteria group bacterium]
MKTLILTTYDQKTLVGDECLSQKDNYQLYTLLKKAGEAVFAKYTDLFFDIQTNHLGGKILDHDLASFDLFIPRSTSNTTLGLNYGHLAEVITHLALRENKRILNGEHLLSFSHDFNKLFQMTFLAKNELPIPATKLINRIEDRSLLNLPQLVKPILGSKGKKIYKIESKQDKIETNSNIIYQEILPHNFDYRVIVLGNKCLGAMKRTAQKDMIVSNFSAGGTVAKTELTDEMRDLSLKSATIFKLEFCGVDLMKDARGQLKILEVNRFPSFVGFTQSTRVKVAELLVDYLIL